MATITEVIRAARILWPNPAPRGPITLRPQVGFTKVFCLCGMEFFMPLNESLTDMFNRVYQLGFLMGKEAALVKDDNQQHQSVGDYICQSCNQRVPEVDHTGLCQACWSMECFPSEEYSGTTKAIGVDDQPQ